MITSNGWFFFLWNVAVFIMNDLSVHNILFIFLNKALQDWIKNISMPVLLKLRLFSDVMYTRTKVGNPSLLQPITTMHLDCKFTFYNPFKYWLDKIKSHSVLCHSISNFSQIHNREKKVTISIWASCPNYMLLL